MNADSPYWSRKPDRFLEVGPHRLASWSVGRGPDLVFIHGWPLHSATFRHVVPLLADSFTCHLLDLPGTGQTISAPDARISFIEHAAVVRGAADALGLKRYGVLAHDSGGFVARRLAASEPRVVALASGDTEIPGHHAWQLALYFTLLRAPFGGPALQLLLRSRTLRRSALAFGPCFADLDCLDGEFHELFVAPLLRSPAVAEGQLRPMRSLAFRDLDDLAEIHRRIRIPVRLIWGARDTFFPIDRARAMLPQFAGPAELCEIAGGKLFAHEEHPAEFAAYAGEFFATHLCDSKRDSVASRP